MQVLNEVWASGPFAHGGWQAELKNTPAALGEIKATFNVFTFHLPLANCFILVARCWDFLHSPPPSPQKTGQMDLCLGIN